MSLPRKNNSLFDNLKEVSKTNVYVRRRLHQGYMRLSEARRLAMLADKLKQEEEILHLEAVNFYLDKVKAEQAGLAQKLSGLAVLLSMPYAFPPPDLFPKQATP